MNDRVEKSFTEWLIEIEKNKVLGEIFDLIKREAPHQPKPDGLDTGPEVILKKGSARLSASRIGSIKNKLNEI